MKKITNTLKLVFMVSLGALVLLLSACTGQTPIINTMEVTRIVEKSVVITEVVFQVITATQPANTATLPSTQTNEPTETPTPITSDGTTETAEVTLETVTLTPDLNQVVRSTDDGFSIWCAKYDGQTVDPTAPWDAPYDSHIGATIQDFTQIVFPNTSCVVIFQLGKTLEEGAALQVYEIGSSTPWLTSDMISVDGTEGAYYTVLNHPYIINPPYWYLSYQFKLVDSSQQELWSRTIEFTRGWLPEEECWDGKLPDPITLRCNVAPEWEPIHTGYWEYKETVAAIDQNN